MRGAVSDLFPRGYPGSGTCRFCKKGALDSDMVKYSTRHYAHPACLYKAKGIDAINALQTWQIRHISVLPMMEAGVPVDQVREWLRRIMEDDARLKRADRAARAKARKG